MCVLVSSFAVQFFANLTSEKQYYMYEFEFL